MYLRTSCRVFIDVVNCGPLHGLEPLHLFMPFEFQAGADGASRRTGLGLPIARHLAIMMGAKIGLFDSERHPSEVLRRPVRVPSTCDGGPVPSHTHFVLQVPCVLAPGASWSEAADSSSDVEGTIEPLPVEEERLLLQWRSKLERTPGMPTPPTPVPPQLPLPPVPRSPPGAEPTAPPPSTDLRAALATAPIVPTGATRRAPRRALVVDDSAANRKVNAKLVQRLGFDVDVAADGEEVLPMLEQAVQEGWPYDGEAAGASAWCSPVLLATSIPDVVASRATSTARSRAP